MLHLRNVLGTERHNFTNEVILDNYAPDGLPVTGALPEEEANGLEGGFHRLWGVGHRPDLHQVFLLDRLNSYKHERQL